MESSSAIELVTEVMKEEISTDPLIRKRNLDETSYNNENEYLSDIVGHNSDDESLSIPLSSNNDGISNYLSGNTVSDAEKSSDRKYSVRNTLKKQILRILSTDDEDELECNLISPGENDNEIEER